MMKQPVNGVGYNKSRARMVHKSKALLAAEQKLQTRKEKINKAILIGSALGAIALGLFASQTYQQKKKSFFRR